MTQPERIQVILGPDDQPTVVNPVHRGAVVDWKATAQLMGRQMLDDKAAREELFTNQKRLTSALHDTQRALFIIEAHWLFKFFPRQLKERCLSSMATR